MEEYFDYFKAIKEEVKKGLSMVKDNIMLTELERKLKKATANEHCHANVSLLNEISQRTAIKEDYYIIYNHCIKKLSIRASKWLKILKTLFLIEHILRTGNLKFAEHLREDEYKLKNLFNFSYYDERSDKGETSKSKIK